VARKQRKIRERSVPVGNRGRGDIRILDPELVQDSVVHCHTRDLFHHSFIVIVIVALPKGRQLGIGGRVEGIEVVELFEMQVRKKRKKERKRKKRKKNVPPNCRKTLY